MHACYPPILLLSFARFNLNVYTNVTTKISTPVNFGRTLQFQDSLIYDLIGIIIHDGRTDMSGHYYAYLRLANSVEPGNSWFVVNDNIVRPISNNEVDVMCTGQHKLGVTPYILSYQCRQSSSASLAPRCACRQTV
jgi:ubiquitin C-terminal hydrolase